MFYGISGFYKIVTVPVVLAASNNPEVSDDSIGL